MYEHLPRQEDSLLVTVRMFVKKQDQKGKEGKDCKPKHVFAAKSLLRMQELNSESGNEHVISGRYS